MEGVASGQAGATPSSVPDFNVLLIEDNPVDALYYIENLKFAFNVFSSGSIESGLARLGQMTVHCVVLDLCLPNGHGLEVIKRVRTAFQNVPIVVVTAYNFDEDDIIAAGAQDYIKKKELWPERLLKIVKLAIVRDQAEKKYHSITSNVSEMKEDIRAVKQAIEAPFSKKPPSDAVIKRPPKEGAP